MTRPPEPADAPPATTPTATPRLQHLRALDGLRGVAVLAVVLYHFAPSVAPGGFLGVDLFFVLSGFLITSLLVNEWDGARRISLRRFWGRRARRLLPALFLLLVVVGLYNLVVTNQVDADRFATDGLAALFYVANWHFITSGQSYIQQFLHQAASPLRHMWSLAIEEQFYLVWPIFVLLLGKLATRSTRPARNRRRFRRLLVAACVLLGVASFVRMITLYVPGSDPTRVYEGTDTRAFVILIGAALGALSAGAPTVVRRARGLLIVIGCVAAAAVVAAIAWVTATSAWLFGGGYGLVVVLMVVVLAAAAQPDPNPLARLLQLRPLVGLGLISYGVYLWHWPVFLWVTSANLGVVGPGLFAARCAITLGASLASYYLVEQPIRRGGLARLGQLRFTVPAVGFATVAAVLVIPIVAYPALQAPPTTAHLTPGAVNITASYAATARCDGGPKPTPIDPGHRVLVQVEGNSIAGEIEPCLSTILKRRGGAIEGVNPAGFLLCTQIPAIEAQARKTHPVAALLFAFVAYDPRLRPAVALARRPARRRLEGERHPRVPRAVGAVRARHPGSPAAQRRPDPGGGVLHAARRERPGARDRARRRDLPARHERPVRVGHAVPARRRARLRPPAAHRRRPLHRRVPLLHRPGVRRARLRRRGAPGGGAPRRGRNRCRAAPVPRRAHRGSLVAVGVTGQRPSTSRASPRRSTLSMAVSGSASTTRRSSGSL